MKTVITPLTDIRIDTLCFWYTFLYTLFLYSKHIVNHIKLLAFPYAYTSESTEPACLKKKQNYTIILRCAARHFCALFDS